MIVVRLADGNIMEEGDIEDSRSSPGFVVLKYLAFVEMPLCRCFGSFGSGVETMLPAGRVFHCFTFTRTNCRPRMFVYKSRELFVECY